MSAQVPGRFVEVPDLVEKWAISLLAGVGGAREWWFYNALAKVGHLRVNVTPAEYEILPPGCAVNDAGTTGPERPRS